MRFEGIVKTWNEDRAFGFIEPAQGGQDVFVHISAFGPRGQKPLPNQRVSFEVELNKDGKKRAKNVALVRPAGAVRSDRPDRPDWQQRPQRSRDRGADRGRSSLFAIALFAVLYAALAVVWRVPPWVGYGYLGLSVICFVTYAADKAAARSGGWRTQESTLLLIGLAGGWPGAMLAQQLLRHKSVKPSFRTAFWGTVVLNVIAFVALSSPRLDAWRWVRQFW